jgi:CRP/FNR family transcriptional regulator, cyclic AMP receptor protein
VVPVTDRPGRPYKPLPLIAVRRGQHVVRQGEAFAGPWVVRSGALLASAVSPEGHVLALDVLGPGDLVGEADGAPAECGVRVLRPGRLRAARPAERADLAAIRARRVAALARDLAWLDVATRIEERLLDLADRFGRPVPGGVLVALPLTQEDLAALTGTSRETANRALHALQREGRIAIAGRGRYVVGRSLRLVAR